MLQTDEGQRAAKHQRISVADNINHQLLNFFNKPKWLREKDWEPPENQMFSWVL